MTAGASPGSGFDLTIRAVVDALQKDKSSKCRCQSRIARAAVEPISWPPWWSSTRATTTRVSVTSLSIMMNELRGQSEYGYADVTMIARLMTEYFVSVTAAGSPSRP